MKTTYKIVIGMFLAFGVFSNATFAQDDTSDGFFIVGEEFYIWQNLQTGETITTEGTLTAIIIEGLGAILIVAFIVIYAIKKRRSK